MSELPEGWAVAPFGWIGTWRGGGTPSKAKSAFWKGGTIPWVSPKDMKRPLIDEAEDQITEAAIAGSATQLIPERSVLLVVRSGILRHTLPVAVNTRSVAINQDLKALTPSAGIDPVFISMQVQALGDEILSQCAKTGTTVDSINFERLKAFPVFISPVLEQRRIVAKIDSLSAKSKRARDQLDHIPRLVEKYKQAILAAAFHGIEAESNESTLEQLAAHITSGSRDWSQYYDRGNCVFVLAGNIKPMVFDPEPKQYVDPPLHGADAKRTLIETGDLLFTIVGANTGDVCHVPSAVTNYFVCQSVALVRLREPARARFIELFLNTETAGKAQINKLIYGQGRPHLSFADLKRLRIPVIEVAKTEAFVQRVNAAFKMIDRLASEATGARKLIDHLDQAILAKAFRGELVPQDPNDEPASVLLERIKAERATGPSKAARTVKRNRRGAA